MRRVVGAVDGVEGARIVFVDVERDIRPTFD